LKRFEPRRFVVRRLLCTFLGASVVLLSSCYTSGGPLTVPATSQVNNPADKMRQKQEPVGQGQPIVVEGKAVSPLREENRIGDYGQPAWTAKRRFSETRVYVRPKGSAEFEYWLQPEIDSNGRTHTRKQYELEFGLPNRFQLDLYLVSHQDGNQGPETFDEQKVEVRYALDDWDVIWGNPTLYLEYASKSNAPDGIEAKLLLGGEVSSGWHWGANLVFEHETGGLQENVYGVTGGVSYTVTDEVFSVGAEVKAEVADNKTDRFDFDGTDEVLLGPSLQYRPLPRAHIDFAALAGVTSNSPDAAFTLLFGWEF